MGFFDRFFKPKIEEKEVNIKKLKPYADELLKDKLENINKKIEEYYHNIEEAKSKIGKNLKILSEAELQNKNVPTRALQMREGHRDAYICENINHSQHRSPALNSASSICFSFSSNIIGGIVIKRIVSFSFVREIMSLRNSKDFSKPFANFI